MSHRKIIVRVGSFYSKPFPLHNGIPQGSPLSVVLFLIAYNKLSDIILSHKNLNFFGYADDFNIIVRSCSSKNPKIDLNHLVNDILNWCKYSGAVLSQTKCKYIHICRKQNCKCSLIANQIQIAEVDNLRILGIIFNKRYNWNSHIDQLQSSLKNQLNVIKCLSSPKFESNVISLLSVVKSLITSKINYGIFLYGYAPKSSLRKIKTVFNAAIRLSLGALRSTPINNMLVETNFNEISSLRDYTSGKLVKSLIFSDSSPLGDIVRKRIKSKRQMKVPSSICRIFGNCSELDLTIKPIKIPALKNPPWNLRNDSIDTSLHLHLKGNTLSLQYKLYFGNIVEKLKEYSFIYTDGSKSPESTSFAVTYEDRTIKVSLLPVFSSIFSAEIIAISEAVNFVKNRTGKYVICTDSFSALSAISNINNTNFYANQIRDNLIEKYPKIILIWVPGHSQISGNDFADNIARKANEFPILKSNNFNMNDIKNKLSLKTQRDKNNIWESSNTWYKNVNPGKTSLFTWLQQNKDIKRLDFIKFSRLRLGHTKLSHRHLINGTSSPICNCDNTSIINIKHFLSNCSIYSKERTDIFGNSDPLQSLSSPSTKSINDILKFIKITKLYHLI